MELVEGLEISVRHGQEHCTQPRNHAPPAAGTFGNEHRNQLTGPGLVTTNLSLSKTFAIWESVKLQVRGDAQNLFNHPSFGLPANQLTVVNGAVVPG